MAKTETWIFGDENGKVRKKTVNPDDYMDDSFTMFFDTRRIGESNYMPSVLLYAQLLGRDILSAEPVPATQKAILTNKNLALLILDFCSLVETAGYQKLYDTYKAGTLPTDLEKILNHKLGVNHIILNELIDRGGFREIVLNAVNTGKINFAPFNTTGDKNPEWFLKYSFSPVPLPGYVGTISNMGKLMPTIKKETVIEKHKRLLKQEIKENTENALRGGIAPETLLLLADEIKERYQTLKDAGEKIIPSPYATVRPPDFVVDVAAGMIFDLRPHKDTLRELLEPGIETLKEFYYAVKRYVAGELKKNNPVTERTPENLFENTPFLMMKNSRESNAIASVSGSMLQIAVQQELALQDENGNTLYNYTATAPVKSGEVIISVKETPKGGVLRPSTEKLHILFDTLFTKSGYKEFVFPIDAYMELCKRTPGETTPEQRRKFRQKLRQDLQRMKSAKFSANLPGCKPGEIGILNVWLPAPNNCMYIKLESLYCDSLNQRNAGKMQIPQTIFKTNEQNPHLIPIMRALCRNRSDYHNINMEYAKGGRRAHTISLKTLYEWDLALPRWAKIKEAKKAGTKWQFRRLIIEPLFNAIKELNDENYITSQYVDKDGIEHTPEEIKNAGIVDILDPEKWLLSYEIVGFKDDPKMIKEAIEREKERIEAAKTKTKKKKKKE